ncbi:MAG: SDR family oxidoreductase [Spirochaetia bacterium]|jgi:NAD(P)-dependent dehydrogenase (short-subunit alcohol dehydrogenase family)
MGGLLNGKVVVVTGGNKGLGRAMAVAAASEGATLVIGGRTEKDGQETLAEIRAVSQRTNPRSTGAPVRPEGRTAASCPARFIRCDLTRVEECRGLIESTEKEFGRIDGLINYAGILPAGTLAESEESLFNDVFNLNIRAAFFCAKHAVACMMKSGGGSIINTGSPHQYGGQFDRAVYACSKGALLTLTKHIANNYAKHHIRCNTIVIGWMATPGEIELRRKQGLDMTWLEEQGKKYVPMGRLQKAEDFVAGSNYLLSDGASQVTGTVLNVTGGMNAW